MSIQNAVNRKFYRRLFRIFKISLIIEYFEILISKLYREISTNGIKVKVFFPHKNYYSHPDIVEKFYGNSAPIRWANKSNSQIHHFIQSVDEKMIDQNVAYVIEPNDHILTVANGLGIRSPREQIKSLDRVNTFLEKKNIKKILVGNDGLYSQAMFYFNSEVMKKVQVYSQYRCRPKLSSKDFIEKRLVRSVGGAIRFLSVASDFNLKAVEILIRSFLEHSKYGHLTLVCHNLPLYWRRVVESAVNIQLIDVVPLDKNLKSKIYTQSDVYINVTHVDSWGAPIEALEYGLPIITCEYHRGIGFVSNFNGFSVSFPYSYYEVGRYGVEWNSVAEYMSMVNHLQRKGGYENAIEEVGRKIRFYENNHNVLKEHSLGSVNHALTHSIWRSNIELVQLYSSINI